MGTRPFDSDSKLLDEQRERAMDNRIIWVIVGIAAIIAMLFSGLLPLPGQKDNVTPLTQPLPPGKSPQPTAPTGPSQKKDAFPLQTK